MGIRKLLYSVKLCGSYTKENGTVQHYKKDFDIGPYKREMFRYAYYVLKSRPDIYAVQLCLNGEKLMHVAKDEVTGEYQDFLTYLQKREQDNSDEAFEHSRVTQHGIHFGRA